MFGLNSVELSIMFVVTVLVVPAARSFTEAPPMSGRKRLVIYGLVLLTCAAAFLNIVVTE